LITIRRIPPRRPATIVAAALLIAASGCGADNGLTLAKVSGKVTFNGKPVTNGTVFFMPDESAGTVGPAAAASLKADGTYIMSTENPSDGVIVGTHRVGITGIEPIEGGEATPEIDPTKDAAAFMKAKAQAARPAPRAKADDEVFTDKGGKKYRYVVPMKFSKAEESGIVVKVDGPRTVDIDITEAGEVKVSP
jgi:hypothetical protein